MKPEHKGRPDLWAALRLLRKNNAITATEFRVYRGQILSGDENACIRGLERKGLITWEDRRDR